MIPAGEYVCPYCASKLTESFYAVSENPVGALLKRKANGHYYVEAYVSRNSPPPSVEYVLEEDEDSLEDGMPNMISVRETKSDKMYLMQRCCPVCINPLPPSYGKLPTFIVEVVGSRTGGKTSWLGSIAYPENNIHVGVAGFPCSIVIGNESVFWEKSAATGELELGNTLYAHLKKDDEEYAIVVLRDFGGELFDKQDVGVSGERVSVMQILRMPDAFLFVADETTDKEGQKKRAKAFELLYQRCLTDKRNRPFGVILSHADTIMEGGTNVSTTKEIRDNGEILKFPLLTKETFPPDTDESYLPENLLPRIELEDMLAMQCSTFVRQKRVNGTAHKSFLVKSCVPSENQENDYSDGINIYDPLLWVLNRLRLFPLQ